MIDLDAVALTVGPDDFLVIVIDPERLPGPGGPGIGPPGPSAQEVADEIARELDHRGLAGRALVIVGPVQLASVARDAAP